ASTRLLARRKLNTFLDKSLARQGDLAWNLEYATAYAYKHIIAARNEITDTIDYIRELDCGNSTSISNRTPYLIFTHLDKAIFGGKLDGMVYLRWRGMSSSSPGTTFAPGRERSGGEKVPRVCIELNSTPFETPEEDEIGGGGIDELLDVLIHQMIHAWFLVCCGAQEEGARQDGRISDGLHFGVILFTLRDVICNCRDGPLKLTFYAVQRCKMHEYNTSDPRFPYLGQSGDHVPHDRDRYISIDPKGLSAVNLPPADGESHCTHDNRKIRYAQIKNWQVENYARAIKSDHESKTGYEVSDLNTKGELEAVKRLHGPPSRTYVELIWEMKRIMVPKAKVIRYATLNKLVEKMAEKRDVAIPAGCSFNVLKFLYDFIQKGNYVISNQEDDCTTSGSSQYRPELTHGPPVIKGPPISSVSDLTRDAHQRLLTQVHVFNLAKEMGFNELRDYALQRMHDMPTTTDDPIAVLVEIYGDGKSAPHGALQHWTRCFLMRKDESGINGSSNPSNLEKLLFWYYERLRKGLLDKSSAFRDDFTLA
ncbi:hypothetical protein K431DRAFT_197958, partial [Polychaeton citri CBS 116435]